MVKTNLLFSSLQKEERLDKRDNRGKRHKVALVLVELALSMLSGRDGSLSSLYRKMVQNHERVCEHLGICLCRVISRSHLPILLSKVDIDCFESVLRSLGTDSLGEGEKGWFAADGKSIRGSIAEGESQGQHIVQIIAHEGGTVVAETFYEGDKESEVAVVRQLLSKGHVCSQGITMDALHCNPTTLKQVAEAQGAFIVGLKGNQPELFQEMERCRHILPVVRSKKEVEKGHGRIDTREYSAYNIDNQYFDLRWDAVNFQTLVTVQRTRFTIKTKKETKTNSIFLSNEPIENAFILFGSIRNHWGIEVNNHFRDVTLQEDKLKTKTKNICRVLALIRTLTLKILRLLNPPNFKAQLELYQDQPDTLLQDLRKLQFL